MGVVSLKKAVFEQRSGLGGVKASPVHTRHSCDVVGAVTLAVHAHFWVIVQ
jgi:hypothetical protein